MNPNECFYTCKWPHLRFPLVVRTGRLHGEGLRLRRLERVRMRCAARRAPRRVASSELLRRQRAFLRHITLSVYYWSP